MLGRIFIGLIAIASLGWIVYSSVELVNQNDQFVPERVFGKEDSVVYIVQNLEKKDLGLDLIELPTSIHELIASVNIDIDGTYYLSQSREHCLFISKLVLNKKRIETLFTGKEITFESSTKFKVGNINGTIHQNKCYFSIQSFPLNSNSPEAYVFDKNADISKIDFVQNDHFVTDIYLKENGIAEYKTEYRTGVVNHKVSDEVIFANAIPNTISSYEFFETDYLRSIDKSIIKSPINNWLKSGLIHLKFKNTEAIITDYIAGQDPIQVLYDFFQKEPSTTENAYFEGTYLCKQLNTANGFYIYNMDDFVVISASRSTCESIIADYKLGQTIAQTDTKRQWIYNNLPQQVNHRLVSKEIKVSHSINTKTLLTTQIFSDNITASTTDNRQTVSYAGRDQVVDFTLLSQNQLVLLTASGKLHFFNNAKQTWEKDLKSKAIGSIQLVDLYANDKLQILVSTQNSIHLFDINGNEVNGFPIQLEENVSQETIFYRWKGNGFFIASLDNGQLFEFDTKGRELTQIRTKLKSIIAKPVVWVSANQPFLGINDGNTFEMINLQNKKSFRTYATKNFTNSAKITNEILLIGKVNGALSFINQKGSISGFGAIPTFEIQGVVQDESNPTIITSGPNGVKLFNAKGIDWSTINHPCQKYDIVNLHKLQDGNSIVSIINDLENNVYLYKTNGKQLLSKTLDGNKKVVVEKHSNYYSVYTIVDNFVIQYKEN